MDERRIPDVVESVRQVCEFDPIRGRTVSKPKTLRTLAAHQSYWPQYWMGHSPTRA